MSHNETPEIVPRASLRGIPPELRNRTYTLAFNNNGSIDENLVDTKPPSKALLLSCRQINEEARGIYKTAYQDYYTKNTFLLYAPEATAECRRLIEQINNLNDNDVDDIKQLIIHGFGYEEYAGYRWLPDLKAWKWQSLVPPSETIYTWIYFDIENKHALEFAQFATLEELKEKVDSDKAPRPPIKAQMARMLLYQ